MLVLNEKKVGVCKCHSFFMCEIAQIKKTKIIFMASEKAVFKFLRHIFFLVWVGTSVKKKGVLANIKIKKGAFATIKKYLAWFVRRIKHCFGLIGYYIS